MGARQSRRSVDITTTPKKEGISAEGGVVGDAAAPGDGKLERIEETDTKPTTNGIAPHTDVAEDKDKDKDDATEKDKDKEKSEEVKSDEKQESAGESPAETAEATTPTEANPASPNAVTSPENKETKKKDKMKKKWSFRSISFSKKDKSKYAREEAPKNGDVTKEEPLTEGGEDAENGSATAGSPVEEKSAVSSPTAENESSPTAAASSPSAETKEESPASAASSPATDDKQEEPTPSAPTPVPVEEKKEEVEKVEAEKKVVEVSPAGGQFVPGPVEVSVFQVQTVATPSIIERKTSEDIPSLPPSSPPPTPIDASPLQQAQQAAATATALAEAFNLPAEAADKDPAPRPVSTSTISSVSSPSCPERNDPSTETAAESLDATSPPQRPPASSADVNPATESGTVLSANAEALPVVDSPVPANESLPDTADAGRTVVDESPVKPPSESVAKPEPVESTPSPPRTETSNTENTEVIRVSSTEVIEEKIEEVACARVTKSDEANNAPVIENEVLEAVLDVVDKQEPVPVEEETMPESVPEQVEELVKQVIEQPEAIREEATDAFLETEEGVIPVLEEILVEAKPAVVIPEEEDATTATVEEFDAEKPVNERIEIIVEDKLEPEVEPDIVVPVEEILVLEEPEDAIVPEEPAQPTTVVIEKQTEIEIIEISDEVTEEMPPPVPESAVPADLPDKSDPENANLETDSKTVPSCLVDDAKSPDLPVESSQEASTVSEQIDIPISTSDVPVSIADESPRTPSTLERVPGPTDEPLPPPTPEQDATQERADSPKYPLPPEELSCPINLSEMKSELPVPDENDAPSPRHPTETLLTPPRSPSPQSIVSIASGLTTSTKDSSQTRLYDDQSNREFKMESVSISLNSYNESDIELKERLAESLVDTVNQEESSVSCQLSNNATSSTTVQETHQSTQETEAPVENSVAHDSTTESSDETSKITTSPAVPSEVVVPASPPSAPAITEDVASVAKAIEEMDISDKAVAAATIECNTNEIIADAHYQNNMNE